MELIADSRIDTVSGIEARGFIFAPALAYRLKAGFVPFANLTNCLRRSSPFLFARIGTDTLEIHKDAIGKGHRVDHRGRLVSDRR